MIRQKLSGLSLLLVVLFLATATTFTLTSCGGGGSSTSGGGTGGSGGGGGGGGGGSSTVTLTSVAPSQIVVGVPQGELVLTGSNFGSSTEVLLDGQPGSIVVEDASHIELELSTQLVSVAGTHTVQVTNPGSSAILKFGVYVPQPGPDVFAAPQTLYFSPYLPGSSTLTDFDGDGRADLIVFNGPSYNPTTEIDLLLGKSDGTFSAPVKAGEISTTDTPVGVLAGDVNGDGYTDAIFIFSGSYIVMLNDGKGNFTPAGSGTFDGVSYGRMAIGDFNHDGKLDFVVDNGGVSASPFYLFLGNGDGTFGSPTPFGAAGNGVTEAVAADLNGDGYTDLVYQGHTWSTEVTAVHIILSQKDGTYIDVVPTAAVGYAGGFAVGDFNGDGVPDLFVTDGNRGQALFGYGDGSFYPQGKVVLGATDQFLVGPTWVVGDFDHDGHLDIATRTVQNGPDEIEFLWGDGKGDFVTQSIASDDSAVLQVGDVNGDGIPDILSNTFYSLPSIILGRKGRNFPSAQPLLPPIEGLLSAGNVYGDGYNDIFIGGYDGSNGDTPEPSSIFELQSNHTFQITNLGPQQSGVLVDLNGDGLADLVTITNNTLLIYKGDGSGEFSTPIATFPDASGLGPVFRDMDGDGHIDMVLPGEILYGKGNFQFDTVTMSSTSGQNFVVGDFDGDGVPDIAIQSGILFGQGGRTFTAPMGTMPPSLGQAADMNGDGKDDLVFADDYNLIEIYTSQGRSGFVQEQVLMVGPPGNGTIITALAIADFNGDGRPDIAATTLGTDGLFLFTNNGSNQYLVTSYAIGVNGVASYVADVNKDGKPDLIVENYGVMYKPPNAVVVLHK